MGANRKTHVAAVERAIAFCAVMEKRQAYDGAGSIASKTNGAAARIVSEYQKAVYTHCASHN